MGPVPIFLARLCGCVAAVFLAGMVLLTVADIVLRTFFSYPIRGMLEHAGVIVTARARGRLVGISRAITDFSFCTYLSDLAVDRAHQRRGIGRELIRRTHEAAGLGTTLILLAAPLARTYYPSIGMDPHDSCWIIPRRA